MNIYLRKIIWLFILILMFVVTGLGLFSQETATIIDDDYIPGLKIDKNSSLNLTDDDVVFVEDKNNYFNIYIKQKESIKSVLITTIPGDRNYAVTSEIYGLRAMEYNKVNGDERRLYQGVFLDMTGIKYFLVDSTAEEAKPHFEKAYHILVPPSLEYGYLAKGQYGKIRLKEGYRINIRTYDKKYADTRTEFRDNVFKIKFDGTAETNIDDKESTIPKPDSDRKPDPSKEDAGDDIAEVDIDDSGDDAPKIEDVDIDDDDDDKSSDVEIPKDDDDDITTTTVPKNDNPVLKFLGREKVANDFIKVFLSYEDDRDFDSILIKESYPKSERFKVLDLVGDDFPKYPKEDMIGNIQDIKLKSDGEIFIKVQIDIQIPLKYKREITITAIDKDGNQAEKPLLLSIVREGVEEIEEEKPKVWTVYFDIDSSALKIETIEELDKIAELVKTYDGKFSILIEAYTDNVGSKSSNLALSKERAEAVKDYLTMKGIDYKIINTKGYGENDPVADNKTRAGRAKNRRVVITLTKTE